MPEHRPKAYEEAGTYLRKIGKTLRSEKDNEWQKYSNELSQKNIRKIRFIEILDSLEGKRIIEGIK